MKSRGILNKYFCINKIFTFPIMIIIIIIKSLEPLRAKKIFIKKKLDHTMVSAIKASSVTL